jgi:hypothetical protein
VNYKQYKPLCFSSGIDLEQVLMLYYNTSNTELCVFKPLSPVFVLTELQDSHLCESEYLYVSSSLHKQTYIKYICVQWRAFVTTLAKLRLPLNQDIYRSAELGTFVGRPCTMKLFRFSKIPFIDTFHVLFILHKITVFLDVTLCGLVDVSDISGIRTASILTD